MPRNGKTIAQRLTALGFNAADPDDRVHDLLDAYEARLKVSADELTRRAGQVGAVEKLAEFYKAEENALDDFDGLSIAASITDALVGAQD